MIIKQLKEMDVVLVYLHYYQILLLMQIVFLGECKYATKKKKIMNTINEDESDDESDDEQNCANRDK